MTKQLLNEEIGRILEIMGTNQSTINESIGDDLIRKIFSRLGKTLGRNTNPVNALRSTFKTATKENFDLLLKNELKTSFAETINRAVSINKSEDEIINKLKTEFRDLFDDSGNFERYLRNRIQETIDTIDNVLTVVKSQPGFSKWLKQSGAEDIVRRYIGENSIRIDKLENTISDLQRVIINEIEYAVKIKDANRKAFFQKTRSYLDGVNTITGGIKAKTIFVFMIIGSIVFGVSVYSMWKKISAVLGTSEIIDDIGERIENIGNKEKKSSGKEGGEGQSTESPLYTGDEKGFQEWCKDNNKYRCQYDPQDNSYFDGFLDEYIFDKDKKIWEPKE